jgi:hypothetical protein
MNDQTSSEELQQLRDRIAQLEAARDKPVSVEIEGLEGLKQWSDAIGSGRACRGQKGP